MPPLPGRRSVGPPAVAAAPQVPVETIAEGPGDLVIPPAPSLVAVEPAEPLQPQPLPQIAAVPDFPDQELQLTPLRPPAAAAPSPPSSAPTPPAAAPLADPMDETPEPAGGVAELQNVPDMAAADSDTNAPGNATAEGEAAVEEPEEPLTAMTMPVPDPSPAVPSGEELVSIAFEADSADFSADADSILSDLAERLSADDALRLQLFSYAGSTAQSAAEARTLSLHRALAVRRFMVDRNIRVTRIDIRALGNSAPGGAADRIDLVLVN